MRADIGADLLHKTSPEIRFAATAELRRGCPVARILGKAGPWYVANRTALQLNQRP